MTITEKNLAEKLKCKYLITPIDDKPWEQIARTAAEELGVELAPEPKPLPTEPGAVIIATEVRGEKGEWALVRDVHGDWFSPVNIHEHHWHRPGHITAWTPARIVPEGELEALADAQDTVEELAKIGVTGADRRTILEMAARLAAHGITQHDVGWMVKQHYSTDEAMAVRAGEPIDLGDVLVGDRVRLVLDNGDEATFTVTHVGRALFESRRNIYPERCITAAYLLNREEEA